MTNNQNSGKLQAIHISQSTEIDRLKVLTIAHLKLKGTLSPLGLCRALGTQPHRTSANTIRDLPSSVKHALTQLQQEGTVKVERIDRHVTRISLVKVHHHG